MALDFVPALPTDQTRSFVGGYPRLPVGMAWPTEDGKELLFLAQVDLADLPWRPDGFPTRGTLYFFHNPRLEDLDHLEIAFSQDQDGTRHPSPFVYFSTEVSNLETVKPTKPHSREVFFQYAGEGYYHYGQLKGPKVARYSLPYAELSFAPYVQYYAGAWFNDQFKNSGLNFDKAYEQFGGKSEELYKALKFREAKNRDQSKADLGVSAPRGENQEEARRRIYGGARHIDCDGFLAKLPQEMTFQAIRQHSVRDERYASWPESGAMVMHHAMSVAVNCQSRTQSKGEDPGSFARQCRQEALDWAEWGYQRAQKPLAQDERDAYLLSARSTFQKAIKIYATSLRWFLIRNAVLAPFDRLTRNGVLALFGKSKGISFKGRQARVIAESLLLLSDAREFGLRLLPGDQILKISELSQGDYLEGALAGQFFGWGGEIQSEVGDNADHLCLAVFYGNRDISFSGDVKIWLAEPLQPDAWQKVKVVNAVS